MTITEYILHLTNYPGDAQVLLERSDEGLSPCTSFVLHPDLDNPKQSYLIVS